MKIINLSPKWGKWGVHSFGELMLLRSYWFLGGMMIRVNVRLSLIILEKILMQIIYRLNKGK